MSLPPGSAESDLALASAAKLLAPVIGPATGEPPSLAADLDQLVAEGDRAKDLKLFFTSRILERSREIKLSSGDAFFQPIAMAAFARFGLRLRRRFFQLIQQDLNAILEGLRNLENRGVQIIDCRKAQFSAEEPIVRIRMICQSWRVMFQAEYSAGQPLCLLVDLKTAVEAALAQTAKSPIEPRPLKAAAFSGVAGSGRQEESSETVTGVREVERPNVAIITDDPVFATPLIRPWLPERATPPFFVTEGTSHFKN